MECLSTISIRSLLVNLFICILTLLTYEPIYLLTYIRTYFVDTFFFIPNLCTYIKLLEEIVSRFFMRERESYDSRNISIPIDNNIKCNLRDSD